MWAHYCKAEKTWLSNLIGEPCNWCGCTETSGGACAGRREHPADHPQYQTNQEKKCYGDFYSDRLNNT